MLTMFLHGAIFGLGVIAAALCFAAMTQTGWWLYRTYDAWKTSRVLRRVVSEKTGVEVSRITCRPRASWLRPSEQFFRLRVDGQLHKEALDAMAEFMYDVARATGAKWTDNRTKETPTT